MKNLLIVSVLIFACSSSSEAPLGEVRCNDDSDCSGGQICEDGFCRIFCNEETRSDPCWASEQVCATELEYCVECTQSSHCGEAHRCTNYSCEFFCLQDSHCEETDFCNVGVCAPKECESSADCGGGETCVRFTCSSIRADSGSSEIDAGVEIVDSGIPDSFVELVDSGIVVVDAGVAVDSSVVVDSGTSTPDTSVPDSGLSEVYLERLHSGTWPTALTVYRSPISNRMEYGGRFRIDNPSPSDPGQNLVASCVEGHRCFSLQIYRNSLECTFGNGEGFDRVQTPISTITVGWHNIQCRTDGINASLLVDGVVRANNRTNFVPPPSGTPIHFAYEFFDGAVSSINLSNRGEEIFNFRFNEPFCVAGNCSLENDVVTVSWPETSYSLIEE
jgi:hypothetical protein